MFGFRSPQLRLQLSRLILFLIKLFFFCVVAVLFKCTQLLKNQKPYLVGTIIIQIVFLVTFCAQVVFIYR